MRTLDPRDGTIELKGAFLWRPKTLGGETRWLEYAVWEVHYDWSSRNGNKPNKGKDSCWANYEEYKERWVCAEKASKEMEEKMRIAQRRLYVLEKGAETLRQLEDLVYRVESHNRKHIPPHMGPEYTSNMLIEVADIKANLEELK